MDYRIDAPPVIRDFLVYHETIKGHSRKTVDEYYLDLRTFFRYIKFLKGYVPQDTPLEDISIFDVDIELIKSVTLADVYSYLSFLARERERNHNSKDSQLGLNAASRARKISTIRSFYKYLTQKANLIDVNPVQDMDSPKIMKTLPRYLSVEEAEKLLNSVSGPNQQRDYCIITLFLNCGLRISEMAGLNLTDIQSDSLRVLGKGNKVRIVYLNEACAQAINDYLIVRKGTAAVDKNALFLSSRRTRISTSAIHALVKKYLLAAGLDSSKYSSHKLRHTAATMLLHNGVDVRTLQELLGHEHLNTTEIYTHVDNADLKDAAELSPLSHFKRDDMTTEKNEDENTNGAEL